MPSHEKPSSYGVLPLLGGKANAYLEALDARPDDVSALRSAVGPLLRLVAYPAEMADADTQEWFPKFYAARPALVLDFLHAMSQEARKLTLAEHYLRSMQHLAESRTMTDKERAEKVKAMVGQGVSERSFETARKKILKAEHPLPRKSQRKG